MFLALKYLNHFFFLKQKSYRRMRLMTVCTLLQLTSSRFQRSSHSWKRQGPATRDWIVTQACLGKNIFQIAGFPGDAQSTPARKSRLLSTETRDRAVAHSIFDPLNRVNEFCLTRTN